MNSYVFKDNIEEIAKRYSDLNKSDVEVIKNKSANENYLKL